MLYLIGKVVNGAAVGVVGGAVCGALWSAVDGTVGESVGSAVRGASVSMYEIEESMCCAEKMKRQRNSGEMRK